MKSGPHDDQPEDEIGEMGGIDRGQPDHRQQHDQADHQGVGGCRLDDDEEAREYSQPDEEQRAAVHEAFRAAAAAWRPAPSAARTDGGGQARVPRAGRCRPVQVVSSAAPGFAPQYAFSDFISANGVRARM